jgi:hypothetical protein
MRSLLDAAIDLFTITCYCMVEKTVYLCPSGSGTFSPREKVPKEILARSQAGRGTPHGPPASARTLNSKFGVRNSELSSRNLSVPPAGRLRRPEL